MHQRALSALDGASRNPQPATSVPTVYISVSHPLSQVRCNRRMEDISSAIASCSAFHYEYEGPYPSYDTSPFTIHCTLEKGAETYYSGVCVVIIAKKVDDDDDFAKAVGILVGLLREGWSPEYLCRGSKDAVSGANLPWKKWMI